MGLAGAQAKEPKKQLCLAGIYYYYYVAEKQK